MSLGIWEMLVLLVIVVLIFGAGKLPKVAGDVAQGIKAFKRNMKDEDEPVAPAQPPAKDPALLTAEKVAADRDRPQV
ncbi:MAG TPA: twin-arginine translocase TatA/TatE family subunit [Geminicoccus sp.]|uniref:twin-arginine translocase TatA/TatE family subunit n=1 Tax=Geminicoccus sp. TaxID=2024832 RepID=UPI002C5E41F2|nr:twin-arginine translocase TatA/TatE family subunit [Geminicoccus sp.]HWL68031.1 twin-arginine translocase TatA/TatE family subunit [Geminicoccus sp.]